MAVVFGALLAGCNDSSDNNDNNENNKATINSDNALKAGQEATRSLTDISAAGEELGQITDIFGSISSSKPDYHRSQKLSARPEETLQCPGGGTITVSVSDDSSTTQSIDYIADQCTTEAGEVLDGELHMTVGPWSAYPQNSFEFIMETGNDGLSAGNCQMSGGLISRLYSNPSSDPYGENMFVVEFGTTAAGFTSFCAPDFETTLAPDTLVRNEFSYTTAEDGSVSGSSIVSINGSVELPDGSGYVDITATGLEYGVASDGSSQYGEAACPSSGEITVSGADGSSVSVYFGDNAPDPYAVQVIGPDGYMAEYQTCEAFLSASE